MAKAALLGRPLVRRLQESLLRGAASGNVLGRHIGGAGPVSGAVACPGKIFALDSGIGVTICRESRYYRGACTVHRRDDRMAGQIGR